VNERVNESVNPTSPEEQHTDVEPMEPEEALKGEEERDLNLTDGRFYISITNLERLVNNDGQCLCVDRECPCEAFKRAGECACNVFFEELPGRAFPKEQTERPKGGGQGKEGEKRKEKEEKEE